MFPKNIDSQYIEIVEYKGALREGEKEEERRLTDERTDLMIHRPKGDLTILA